MIELEGYVLTGGASTRMGRDKSRLELAGSRLGERAASALRRVTKSVYAVGSAIEGYEVIHDVDGKSSPAAIFGVLTALQHSQAVWTAILACDLPFVSPDLFRLMISTAENEKELDAVVPAQQDGRLQPLAAVYRTNTCLAAVNEMLRDGELRLGNLFERVRIRRIVSDEYISLPNSGRFFFNINTPDDYKAAKEIVDRKE